MTTTLPDGSARPIPFFTGSTRIPAAYCILPLTVEPIARLIHVTLPRPAPSTVDAVRRGIFNTFMPDARTSYESLVSSLHEVALLGSVASVLNWDERTQLPPRGTAHRARQLSLLARMTHEQFTAPRIGELLDAAQPAAQAEPSDGDIATNVRHTRRAYERAKKLPPALVEELASTSVLAQQSWGEARARSDYAGFAPWLVKILALKRQEAACVGFTEDPYDALLDEFEPGATAAELRQTFDGLRGPLVALVEEAAGSPQPQTVFRAGSFARAAQEVLAREAASAIGFDFEAGRLDVSLHPFCTDLGPGDTRMTTRYHEDNFFDSFFGVLHETGHGLYTQGLPVEHFGTPCGEYVSLGIHESQSRLWENFVGRGRPFWKHFLPRAKAAFPAALGGVNPDDWHRTINQIRPSLIRTEADEATYNLHVLLRFELEQSLLRDELSVADLPAAWAAKMRKYLGLTPPDDARGCLQDIHWSGGAIGYFPTYTLGNLYAAQFFEQARHDLGDLDASFADGEFQPLLEWLRENIHRHGKRYSGQQLVLRVTGKPLSPDPLVRHLKRKVQELRR